MFGNSKHAFWQALVITLAIFFIGIFIGFLIESGRVDKVERFYAESEIALIDILALSNFIGSGDFSCQEMIFSNLEFADRIYEEAIMLEDYENVELLGDDFKIAHKRYDLLRAFLWMNSEKTREVCKGNFNVVVYLYEQESEDLVQKATQNVWSRVLFDLKEKRGADIILIPLAVDGGLDSVGVLVSQYDIKSYPVVVINDNVISSLKSVEELEGYLI